VQVADHISADSHATRQDLLEILQAPPEKVTTIHLAADPLYERPYEETIINATLRQYNLSRGFILFVGTLEPRKNLPMLLRAYNLLYRETTIDLPLVLIGSKGWIYDEIFDTIDELDLRQQVRHLSGIADEQLAHLQTAAGLLVTPSYYEGFGLPALQAMHCGCPVIASNRGSLPEVVGEAGILLEPDDPEAWAEAMAQVYSSPDLRARMVANGRVQAQTFSWQKTAAATLKVYHS
jgi:glycosyltransferase involved in cell wall biosynthesis